MRQMLVTGALITFSIVGITGCDAASRADSGFVESQETLNVLDVDALLAWEVYGRGTVEAHRGQAVILREASGSSGLMLVSPGGYGTNVVVRYRVLTLQPGTVLVTILSASGPAGQQALSLPADYDGGIGPWLEVNPNYFVAFHNAAHMRYPFVMRVGGDGNTLLEESKRSHMIVGRWHDIEVGRRGGHVWLSIDGERVLDVNDTDPLGPGKLALRIRGTGPEIASAIIRDLEIHSF